MSAKMKLLYICTHNRCRSILSEAITADLAADVIDVRSAGSEPAGQVHPSTLQALQRAGIDHRGWRSESLQAHQTFAPDVVITVCDHAAAEACPVWLGNALRLHWGLPDPSKLQLDEVNTQVAFDQVIAEIRQRVMRLRDIAQLSPQQWSDALHQLVEEHPHV